MMIAQVDLASLRADFPLATQSHYLNSCSKGALSRQVREAFTSYLNDWDQRGAPWDLWLPKIEEVRERFAQLINAGARELAVTFCVSTGTNAIASSFDFRGSRNKILLSDDEFPTMAHIWGAQQHLGAQVEFIRPQPGEDLVEAFERHIDDQTLLVVAHQIHHKTGNSLNVERLTRSAHAAGALLLMDAYHSAGVMELDVRKFDIDFLVTGCMKYLLGSTGGVALLYVRENLIPMLKPTYTGWFGQENEFAGSYDGLKYDETAKRFELGLQPIGSIYAAAAGLELIHEVGVTSIEAHACQLAERFGRGIRDLGLVSETLPGTHGPMISVPVHDGITIMQQLRARQVIVGSWENTVRFSFHCYNTEDDANAGLEAVACVLNAR